MVWAPDYITAAELKHFVGITDTADDAEIAFVVTALSRCIDNSTHRQFGSVAAAEERFYSATWNWRRQRYIIYGMDDVHTTTGMVVTIGADVITDYTLEPRNAVAKGMVWTHMVLGNSISTISDDYIDDISIVSPGWGWSAVPVAIKEAGLLQGSRFMARRTSPFGVAGSPEQGNELRLLEKLDPDVAINIKKYIRHWGAV